MTLFSFLGGSKIHANHLKINDSRYISLFVVRGSTKKLFSVDYVNIYLFSIFFSIDSARWKSVEVFPHWFINFKKRIYTKSAASVFADSSQFVEIEISRKKISRFIIAIFDRRFAMIAYVIVLLLLAEISDNLWEIR